MGAASAFKYSPWLHLETNHGEAIVMLWLGSRPIPSGDYRAKPRGIAEISVVLPVPAESMTLPANKPESAETLERQAHPSSFDRSGIFWDIHEINPPSAGCWEYTIAAALDDGTQLSIPFTFVAVE